MTLDCKILDNPNDATAEPQLVTLRSACRGMMPLDGRLEAWMVELFGSRKLELFDAIDKYGSPLNVVATSPLRENIAKLDDVARQRDLDFRVFFARKANKCLAFVEAALQSGAGVDIASEQECRQALRQNANGKDVICTAAVKTQAVVELCVASGITIAIDNHDELLRVSAIAKRMDRQARIAVRVSGFHHDGEKLYSRFGFDVDELPAVADAVSSANENSRMQLVGVHFHLDGYCARQRTSAIRQSLNWVDRFRSLGHAIQFLDIGGGLPMSYLESESQWNKFWSTHAAALLDISEPITYRNHGLGRFEIDGEIRGRPNVYPYWQKPVREQWLCSILDFEADGETIADSIRDRSLQLRCEPGRSVLDGCGVTIARVEYRKKHANGDWLIGLAMNRTQCRTSSDDFLVDPILLPADRHDSEGVIAENREPMEGYLVGAYCTESELLSLRKLRFPNGVSVGDCIAFPNTAGYMMHFLESRSHQFPLGKNIIFDRYADKPFRLDEIDNDAEGIAK